MSPAGPPALWVCPRCGARLVSRNLSHSCGEFSLEDLYAGSGPAALDLARDFVELLRSLGDVQVIVQKTRAVCVARVRFASFQPRKHGLLANFALRYWLDSPRIVKKTDYGPRWRMHAVQVSAHADLDPQLRAWLQESHDTVGVQSDLY